MNTYLFCDGIKWCLCLLMFAGFLLNQHFTGDTAGLGMHAFICISICNAIKHGSKDFRHTHTHTHG